MCDVTHVLGLDVASEPWHGASLRLGRGLDQRGHEIHTSTALPVLGEWLRYQADPDRASGTRGSESVATFDIEGWAKGIHSLCNRALLGASPEAARIHMAIPVLFGHPDRVALLDIAAESRAAHVSLVNCTSAALVELDAGHLLIPGTGLIIHFGFDSVSMSAFVNGPDVRLLGHGGGVGIGLGFLEGRCPGIRRPGTPDESGFRRGVTSRNSCDSAYLEVVEDLAIRSCEVAGLQIGELSQVWLVGSEAQSAWLSTHLDHRHGLTVKHLSPESVAAGAVKLGAQGGALSELAPTAVGIETAGADGPSLRHVFQRGTALPASAKLRMRPSAKTERTLSVHIYEGDTHRMSEARRVATIEAPPGQSEYSLTLTIDEQAVIGATFS